MISKKNKLIFLFCLLSFLFPQNTRAENTLFDLNLIGEIKGSCICLDRANVESYGSAKGGLGGGVKYTNTKLAEPQIIPDKLEEECKKERLAYMGNYYANCTFRPQVLNATLLENEFKIKPPILGLRWPGLNFQDLEQIVHTDELNRSFIKAPWLAEFIEMLYRLLLGIISIVAVIMIILEGIKIIMSGTSIGDSADPSSTRVAHFKNISRILAGLLIAWTSYFILYQINPNLTKLSVLETRFVQRQELTDPGEGEGDSDESIGQTGTVDIKQIDVRGKVFPIEGKSLDKILWNWGHRRSGGDRCHAGIDLLTKSPGYILAVDDGIVTRVSYTFYNCKKAGIQSWGITKDSENSDIKKDEIGQTGAVFIYHPNLKITIAYTEIDSNKINVKEGESVSKGKLLGVASYCGMLHFEAYEGSVNANTPWYPPKGSKAGPETNYCQTYFLHTKPAKLLNPHNIIKQLGG